MIDKSQAIAANVELPPKRYPDLDTMDLMLRATKTLISEAELEPADIEGVLAPPAYYMTLDRYSEVTSHETLYDELGLQPKMGATVYVGGATFGVMIREAVQAIDAGNVDSVLCVGAGKFPRTSEGAGDVNAKRTSQDEFEYPYGPYIPVHYSLGARRHMYEYGTTKADFANVAVTEREWALLNPNASMNDKGPITVNEILESPKIVEPFHRYHCSVPTDGGGAFLVTTGEKATELTDRPAYIRGIGEAHTHKYISSAPSYTAMGSVDSGNRAFEMTSLTPDDVDVAQLYDAFASNPLMYAEELGLTEEGKGSEFFANGHAGPGGDLPVNTHGGLISAGHTGAAAGMSILNEAITQTRGTAGERQVADADVVLGHTAGGVMSEYSTIIFGREPNE